MTIRDIRLFGDPVLLTKADEVTEFDDSLASLVEDMFETMDAYEGVGLAANQIGVTRRVFVFDTSHKKGGFRGHIVNPVWEAASEEMQIGSEGCLSIPDISKDTERFMNVHVTGVDMNGQPVEFDATDLLARCVQHETDHLDGVLFIKRLSRELRKEAMAEIRSSEWFN